ncbi:MAG: TIGR03915 family putative DNA repair protein [Oscillospiraceae bacterium]|nr:TIGR03915 family putative DNA repair protein [Oscillospiraceae bacterium]
MREVCYEYDGTFAGFLTCVFYSYANREEAVCFQTPEETGYTLWPTRRIDTEEDKAQRVYRSIAPKMGGEAAELVWRAFLTCLPEREVHIYRFLRYGYERGTQAIRDLGDERVYILHRAVRHLGQEAHLLTGFVRFADFDGVLMGEIEPKNRVLPLLRRHFVSRYNTERFLLYDRTHRETLVYSGGQWAIVPVEGVTLPPPGEEELRYRRLWRKFYDTIAIEGRLNPKCRMTHMPKRYWGTMTEFQTDEGVQRAL